MRPDPICEPGEPRAQHLVIVAAECITGHVGKLGIGEDFFRVARLLRQVIHACGDDAQRAGNQLPRAGTPASVALHVVHLAMPALFEPAHQPLLVGGDVDPGNTDLLEAELATLRQRLLGWRFYHQFRTDEASPLRQPQGGVFTPILAHDGADLAAALQTIREQEPPGGVTLDEWLERALPGATLRITHDRRAMFGILLDLPGIARPLRAAEISDGQLCFLCLLAALLSPRPSELLVLNEPETSLHPSVLPVLADLIAHASRQSQILVTTHERGLAQRIATATASHVRELELRNGETRVAGRGRYE